MSVNSLCSYKQAMSIITTGLCMQLDLYSVYACNSVTYYYKQIASNNQFYIYIYIYIYISLSLSLSRIIISDTIF